MKKRIFCALLAVVMIACLLPVSAFAEGEKAERSETLTYNGNTDIASDHFQLSSQFVGLYIGWICGNAYSIQISALPDAHVRITHIDATIRAYGDSFDTIQLSSGTAEPKREVVEGETVYLNDINESSITIRSGSFLCFDQMVIYYETCEDIGHDYGEDGYCTLCGEARPFAYGLSKTDTIPFKNCTPANSSNGLFSLQNNEGYDDDGWKLFGNDTLTISAKEKGVRIKAVTAVLGYYRDNYGYLRVNSGNKWENGWVDYGRTVHIDNIDTEKLVFSMDASTWLQLKDFTIYYETCAEDDHVWQQDGTCRFCDALNDSGTASALSEGSVWIIAAIAAAAVVAVGAIVVVKKKKKPAGSDE